MSRSKNLQQQAGERQLNHMFGYVTVDKPELKVKEFYQYKAYERRIWISGQDDAYL